MEDRQDMMSLIQLSQELKCKWVFVWESTIQAIIGFLKVDLDYHVTSCSLFTHHFMHNFLCKDLFLSWDAAGLKGSNEGIQGWPKTVQTNFRDHFVYSVIEPFWPACPMFSGF